MKVEVTLKKSEMNFINATSKASNYALSYIHIMLSGGKVTFEASDICILVQKVVDTTNDSELADDAEMMADVKYFKHAMFSSNVKSEFTFFIDFTKKTISTVVDGYTLNCSTESVSLNKSYPNTKSVYPKLSDDADTIYLSRDVLLKLLKSTPNDEFLSLKYENPTSPIVVQTGSDTNEMRTDKHLLMPVRHKV